MSKLSENKYSIYFGDLHTHNNVGYGLGSLKRTYDIARSFHDFLCFTAHAYRDTYVTENIERDLAENKLERPFVKITHDRWPEVVEFARRLNKPGKFVTFPGYERHSSSVGDFHVIFPYDDPPLNYYREFKDFKEHILKSGAIMVPHSPAYPAGATGAVPRLWDPRITPILEIYSTHGCAESDTAPKDYTRHPGTGRVSSQTMQAFLAAGYRFGVVASTDNHIGFPGGYWEGLAAVIAPELRRDALFDALKNRRTYAVSGDRIELDFRINGHLMGEEMPYTKRRKIATKVHGWNWVDRVEVLKNNRVIYRDFPIDKETPANPWNDPVLIRIEYGWGPMLMHKDPLEYVPPVCDWDMKVTLAKSKILDIHPCFQSIPFDEDRRHVISGRTNSGFNLVSYTARRRSYEHCDTNAVVLKVQASSRDELKIELKKPMEKAGRIRLSELLKNDHNILLKHSLKPLLDWGQSVRISRLIPEENVKTEFSFDDEGDGKKVDWYYVRVIEKNGQLAWSSPIWIEKK